MNRVLGASESEAPGSGQVNKSSLKGADRAVSAGPFSVPRLPGVRRGRLKGGGSAPTLRSTPAFNQHTQSRLSGRTITNSLPCAHIQTAAFIVSSGRVVTGALISVCLGVRLAAIPLQGAHSQILMSLHRSAALTVQGDPQHFSKTSVSPSLPTPLAER